MIAKTFEIRDKGTFIPVMAVKLVPGSEADRYLLARAGYGRQPDQQAEYIMLIPLAGGSGQAHSDPYEWPSQVRTYLVAHEHIIKNWDMLLSGDVVCVEFILGERSEPKQSESETCPI